MCSVKRICGGPTRISLLKSQIYSCVDFRVGAQDIGAEPRQPLQDRDEAREWDTSQDSRHEIHVRGLRGLNLG